MGNEYQDDRYGIITRKWFGLTKKLGGETAAGFTFGTTDATKQTHVTRYYPKGPCKIIKFGALRLATMTQASSDRVLAELIGRGASASVMASFLVKDSTTAESQYTIASIESSDTTDFPIVQVKAGEYIAITTGTPSTDKGTAANTATLTGTVAFFVDIVPTWDANKWNPDEKKYQA